MTPQYPNHHVPNKEKLSDSFGLKYAQAMFQDFSNSSFYLERSKMIENRQYRKGQQKTDKYKQLMDQEINEGYLNLDWSPISVLPKMCDIIQTKLARTSNDINVRSVDSVGVDVRREFEHMLKAQAMLAKRAQQSQIIQQMFGESAQMTSEDIEMFMEMDYKDTFELAAEEISRKTYELSDMSTTMPMVYDNLITEGLAGVRIYDDEFGHVKFRKVNPVETIFSSSQFPDFRDAYHFGERLFYTVSELMILDTDNKISKSEWESIARANAGEYGNARWPTNNQYFHVNESYWDNFRIPVLDFEFKTFIYKTHSKKSGKYQDVWKERDEAYQASGKNQKVQSTAEVWMTGLHIIGTDYLLHYGPCTNMVRGNRAEKEYRKSYSNFILYCPSVADGDSEIQSLVNRAKPYVDAMVLAWLNLQNVIARAVPKGGYVDADALAKAAEMLGLGSPLEIFKLYKAKGWLIGGSTTIGDTQIPNQKPIHEMENGLGKDFSQYMAALDFFHGKIQEVTGLNAVVDASTPDSNTLVGVAQVAETATNYSLGPFMDAKRSMLERLTKSCTKKVQMILKTRAKQKMEIPPAYVSLGNVSIDSLIATSFDEAEFNFTMKQEPSQEEMTAFYQELERSVQAGMLQPDQSMMAKNLAKESVKKAQLYLKKELQKNRQLAQQSKQQDMMMNQQIQQQSAQQKMQEELAIIQAKGDSEMKIKQLEMQMQEQKYQFEMQLARLRSELEFDSKMKLQEADNDDRLEEVALQETMRAEAKSKQPQPASNN